MTDSDAILVAAIVLGLVVVGAAVWFAIRAEHAANKARTAWNNARADRDEVRQALQQIRGMVAAFREGRPSEVDNRPTCPMDGEPLLEYRTELGKPATFVHADGTSHLDRMAGLAIQALLPGQASPQTHPSLFQAPEPVHEPIASVPENRQPAGAADLYMDRARTAEAAGMIDPDKLIAGVGDITRNGWDPLGDGGQTLPPMPDPTRAGRVARARRGLHRPNPSSQNGDGS